VREKEAVVYEHGDQGPWQGLRREERSNIFKFGLRVNGIF